MFRFPSGANAPPGSNSDVLTEDGGINVRALPSDVQAVFDEIDANGDGVLDMDEFRTMLSTYAVLRKANDEGSVAIAALPDKVQPALKVFDQDGDGTVDPKELMRAAELYQASKKTQKRMRKFIIGLMLFVIALIGINSAMTFMMVELGKETKAAPDGIMRVNTNTPDQPGAVVRTAANAEGAAITSALPDAAFAELKRFEVKSASGAYLSLMVLGWYRIPDAQKARTGSFVKIITYAGFITLDGDVMTFEETLGTVFSEAGFDVVNGRKLLGIYELIGLFNSIENWDGLDADAGELKPSFGSHDFEMKYIERIPCTENVTCVNYLDDTWHKAAGPVGALLPEYIDIVHEVLYDSDTRATSEATHNAEYPDAILHTYKSAYREVNEQISKTTGQSSYCFELDGDGDGDGDVAGWNVTEAVKVGESLAADGRMVRHFRIGAGISEAQHDALTLNAPEEVPYTGSYTVEYYDDKATGHPVRFVMAGREFIVTSYEEVDVEFPDPDDEAWDNDPECVSGDAWEDISLPARVQSNPFLLNLRDRMIDEAKADNITDLVLGANANNTNGRRRLQSESEFESFESSSEADFVDLVSGGARRELLFQKTCTPIGSCYGKTDKMSIGPIKIGKYKMNIQSWKGGGTPATSCGLSSIAVSGQCPFGLTCYGTCSGTTPLLCQSDWGMYCAIGVTMNVNDLVPKKVTDALKKLNVKAEIGAEMGYTAQTKTMSVKVWGSIAAGDKLSGRRLAARRLLAAGPDDDEPFNLPTHTVDDRDFFDPEVQMTIEDHLSDVNGRKLLWSGKKIKKQAKKTVKSTAKGVKKAAKSKTVSGLAKGANSVAVAAKPKSGVAISVSGTGALSLGKKRPKISVTASVDGKICVVGVCFTVAETVLNIKQSF